jgi:hypothetical protein
MASVKEVDQATFQKLLASDPDVQAVIQKVWGNTPVEQRPGDTPKNLEQANDQASKQIAQILKSKGVQLPAHTFINPRTNSLEAEHGWAGLPTAAKIAIIAAAGATGVGALGAMGAFGGAAAAGAGGAGASGAAAGGAGAAGAGAAGAGGLLASTPLLSAAPMIGSAAATGGSLAGGLGAAAGAAGAAGGSGMTAAGLLGTAAKAKPYLDALGSVSSVLGKQQEAAAKGKADQAQLNQGQDRNAISLYGAQNAAENQAAQTDLERQQFGNQNRSTTAKQALIGALLGGGVQPTSIKDGAASGGLLRSLNGNQGALAAMQALGSQGSTAQNTPLSFSGGKTVAPPTLTSMPQIDQGGLMSTLATLGQLAGATSPYLKKPTDPTGGA